ncbi:MAG: hypothetical protein ACREJX_06780, partial [Polyangiaceae bacterium]
MRGAGIVFVLFACSCAHAPEHTFREEPEVIDDNARVVYADEQDEMISSAQTFDRAAVRIAMRVALLAAKDCSPSGLNEEGAVRFSMLPSGESADVEIDSPKSDPSSLDCMRAELSKIRIKPFTGDPIHVVFSEPGAASTDDAAGA